MIYIKKDGDKVIGMYSDFTQNTLLVTNVLPDPIRNDFIPVLNHNDIDGFYYEYIENIDIPEAPFPPTILEENKVPEIISTLQGKLQLLKMGLIDTIEAIIAQSGQAENIYWKDSATWERSSPILNRLAPVIGMNQEGLDQFFINASKLK